VEFYYRDQDEPRNEKPEDFWKRTGKKWCEGLDKFIDKKKTLQEFVAQTVSPSDSPEVKLRKLYDRVQQFRNTSYDSSKTAKEEKREKLKDINNVEDLIKRGYGTGRHINYLFVGLARAEGFEASSVFVASRNQDIFYPQLEDTAQLINDDLVSVRVGDKYLFLDPAAKYYPYGELPWDETGVQGLRVNTNGGEFVDIPLPLPDSAGLERHADLKLDAEGALNGKLNVDFTGIRGSMRRNDEREADEAGRKKSLEDEIKAWLPNGSTYEITKREGWDKTAEPLRVEGTVKIPSFTIEAGRRVLMPITFLQAPQPAYFQHEKRVNTIYFHYPYTEKDSLTIHLVDGFAVDSLPAVQKLSPGGGFLYQISASKDGTAVKTERVLTVDGMFYPASAYPALRQFFSKVKTNDDSQIVLQSTPSVSKN